MLGNIAKKIFGTANERYVNRVQPLIDKIKQNLVAIQVRGPLEDPDVSYVLVKDIVDFLGSVGAGGGTSE